MNSKYNDIIGDDEVFYSPSATDELVSDAKMRYNDFMKWLDECEDADAVFDSVISPYFKGNPPSAQRMKKKRSEYEGEIQDAKNIFDDTLEKVINYIIDYSNNLSLALPKETAMVDTVFATTPEFVVEDESAVEETIVTGEVGLEENSEVSE